MNRLYSTIYIVYVLMMTNTNTITLKIMLTKNVNFKVIVYGVLFIVTREKEGEDELTFYFKERLTFVLVKGNNYMLNIKQ